jgi:hypothetical protein
LRDSQPAQEIGPRIRWNRDADGHYDGGKLNTVPVTPWFYLTGDLQVVDNESEADGTAIILGLRAKIVL